MNIRRRNEEIRWQVIVSMLEEFPTLKKKLEDYLKASNSRKQNTT